MDQHGFKTAQEFRGRSLPYFTTPTPTTHADLVQRQAEARANPHARAKVAEGTVTKDTQWTGDKFVEQSQRLVAGQ